MNITHTITIEERLEKILKKAIKEIKESVIKELFKEIIEVLREMSQNMKNLTKRLDELTERVNQLTEQVSRLTGAVSEIRGEISEWKIVDSLKGILRRHNLEVYASPWRLFDAYVIGDEFLAIMEICRTCRRSDIDQIKRAVGVAIDKLGTRPDILIVFSLEKPEDDVVIYGRKMGVVVENSPIRLAKILRDLIEKKKT